MFPIPADLPLQKLQDPLLQKKGIQVYVKREDLIHQEISGNKWRKLKYNIQEARQRNYDTLLTFGGAYSNHIAAVAAAGKLLGFKTIGIIRGEETSPLNPTLHFAAYSGMKLRYIDREQYRHKTDPDFIAKLYETHGNFYLIPEGGTNALAVKGCAEIPEDITIDYDYIAVAAGTAGTATGLVAGLKGEKQVLAFSALLGDFHKEEIKKLLHEFGAPGYHNWKVETGYHFGGYAKMTQELLIFIRDFHRREGILLDPVYTCKMMFGIYDKIHKDEFKSGETIVALHTGGLQGWHGMKKEFDWVMNSKL